MDKRDLGAFGEKKACAYLRTHAYRIVEQNYSCRFGEIDIIARKGGYIVFAEVKLRKDDSFAPAREFVTKAKQERIIKTAQIWLAENDCELQPRFDVIEVYGNPGKLGRIEVNHIENAF